MATIVPHTTRAVGTVLTASIYNADHVNHVTNANALNAELLTNPAGSGFTEGSTPGTPPAGHVLIYAKSDKHLYQLDSTGLETDLAAVGGVSSGKIVESRAANAVTFALKTLTGADPSVASPVTIVFPDASSIVVTAALSVTVPSGATLGAVDATAFRIWIAIVNDAGTARIAVRNCLVGTNITGFPSTGILSSVALSAGSDSGQVTYTGTAVTDKTYVVSAYADYESGLTTAGTWNAAPTRVNQCMRGFPLPSDTVQTQGNGFGSVASGTTNIPTDDTIPQNTEGDQYLSQDITPMSPCNICEVRAFMNGNVSIASTVTAAIFKDSAANAVAASWVTCDVAGSSLVVILDYKFLYNSAALTTLKVRAGKNSGGTFTVNGAAGNRFLGGVLNTNIQLVERMA